MTDSLTPRPSDAILGGQTPPPITGAILGGLEGAKQRLESEALTARLSALQDAVQYGEQGLDLAIQALQDPADELQRLACRLLRNQAGEGGKQALLKHRPLSYFTTFADWRFEDYNPATGITDPTNNAAVLRMTNSGRSSQRAPLEEVYDLSQFEALLEDPRAGELEALIFQIDYNYWDSPHTFGVALEAICDAKNKFSNLKALFVGDSEGDHAPAFRKSKLSVFDIRPFLEAFPRLEVLHVFGSFGCYDNYVLKCAGFRHEHLKTLIIETADITQPNVEQLCSIDLPELEYFELWSGRNHHFSALPYLQPIFDRRVYPKLKYLGLCSSEEINILVQQLVQAPLMSKLIALDLNMSSPQEDYYYDNNPQLNLHPLKDPKIVKNLQLLNLSGLFYSSPIIAELSQNIPQVIALGQDGGCFFESYTQEELGADNESHQLSSLWRHAALYE